MQLRTYESIKNKVSLIYNEYNKVITRSITELLRSRPTPGAPDPDEEHDLLLMTLDELELWTKRLLMNLKALDA